MTLPFAAEEHFASG